jgi:UDP-hydrolysing UDP-N-acetyl-D-glucosamine 2-epimerase
MAFSVGKAICGFSRIFARIKPDIVVVLGDRGEMLAAAIAANYLNIPVAHIHGGEVSGHIDGILRHAITKLSQLHFPTTKAAKERLCRMGEDPRHIFMVGAPALDRVLYQTLPNKTELRKKYRIDEMRPLAILAQHPVSAESEKAAKQIEITIKALRKMRMQILIVYPNADAGGRSMIKVIKRYENFPGVRSYKSIPHKEYLGLMRFASVLVGNSSSGIIEAPSFKLAVINIGARQLGREQSMNVINVDHNEQRIKLALKRVLYDKDFKRRLRNCKNPYGDGHAGKRIARILGNAEVGLKLLNKRMTY